MTTDQNQATWCQIQAELREYGKIYRDWTEKTTSGYQSYVERFHNDLEASGPKGLEELEFKDIQDFACSYAAQYPVGSQRSMFEALRAFLGFCYWKGLVPQDLSYAVPRLCRRRLDRVPFVLSQEQGDAVLNGVDCSQSIGKRDFAILQLLKAYGVRGCQIRHLQLDDLLWEQSQIRFRAAKGGKELIFPLPCVVGNALVDYLYRARPQKAPYREVFLTQAPSSKPITRSSTLSAIVARRIRLAGVEVPAGTLLGSHLFRHTLASRMLDSGAPMKWIADVLGHRSLNSTFIYTKIDNTKLAEVALDWPKEVL